MIKSIFNFLFGQEDKNPGKIKGVTVQCKNCDWWGERGHCGIMPSEVMDGESWCATKDPKFFFKKKI
jgi:hypothetical protein